MSVIVLNGLPGKGKTLTSTDLALKHYKKENRLLKRIIRRIKKEPTIINNVYSNYPILLDKKRNIYCRKFTVFDLMNQWRFIPGSLLISDEIQLFFDSDEYVTFPKPIANFLQAHRHFLIKDIIFVSQHPSRVVKKIRNVTSEFYRIKTRFVIPILKVGFISARITYEFADYDLAFTKDRELRKLKDIKSKIIFMNFRKNYKRYDTIYLNPLNADKPLLDRGTYNSLYLDKNDQLELFDTLFGSQSDLKKKIGESLKNENQREIPEIEPITNIA